MDVASRRAEATKEHRPHSRVSRAGTVAAVATPPGSAPHKEVAQHVGAEHHVAAALAIRPAEAEASMRVAGAADLENKRTGH